MPLSILPSDEILVSVLETFVKNSHNVYHLEVYQNAVNRNAALNFPCCVYARRDFSPGTELAGESGIEVSTFNVTVIAQNSSELRNIADNLHATYKYEWLQELQASKPYVLDWQVSTDTESIEFPVQQNDKGYKMTDIGIIITVNTFTGDPCQIQ